MSCRSAIRPRVLCTPFFSDGSVCALCRGLVYPCLVPHHIHSIPPPSVARTGKRVKLQTSAVTENLARVNGLLAMKSQVRISCPVCVA